jgi:serine/threonine protein kinase
MLGYQILHYRIVDKLGQGGMGVVYKADDTKLLRPVALKFLAPKLARNASARARFLVEAQAASALNHPNICTIHAVEEAADLPVALLEPSLFDGSQTGTATTSSPWDAITGTPWAPESFRETTDPGEPAPFIVMEYVRGTLLSDRIAVGVAPPSECVAVAMQIAEGLSQAHTQGIVHRDIKPPNIMITEPGLVKIMDFGIARRLDAIQPTSAGSTMGTLAYMSPEQIRGASADHRTDIYSLGVVLYELATGHRPFEGGDPGSVLYTITHNEPLAPSETGAPMPRRLELIILRCLRKSPGERYGSAAELLADLRTLKTELDEAARTERRRVARTGPDASERESERRHATIMFGEIRQRAESDGDGADDWGPAAAELMSDVPAIAARYGGTVDRMMGGSFTVLFGLPSGVENTARQALNAAIAIRNAVRAANQACPPEERLAVHLGVNTGTVVAGAVGAGTDRQYSVLGDTVVVASKLKDHAPDGRIYVGPQTMRLTREEFSLAALPPLQLRGRKEPLSAYDVVSQETVDAPAIAADALGAQMVGRHADLAALEQHLLKLLAGSGSIVTIAGEPGIGKSRLVAELLARAEGIAREGGAGKLTLLVGRALSTGTNLGYHPIIEMLRRWAGIRDDDSKTDASAKLEAAIGRVDRAALLDDYPFIATMMGLELSGAYALRVRGVGGDALGRLILRSLRDLLERAAAARPLVMVLEDLHWADQSSIELLEGLFRSAERHRMLFVGTFRSDYPGTSERLLETVRSRYGAFYTGLQLKPLDGGQAKTLIEQLLRGLPQSAQDRILARAGGNPLFIEQIVRSLVDAGAIEVAEGTPRVTPRMADVVIPETIQELLIARLDLLDERTRSIAKVASVVGRSFLHRVLAAVACGTSLPPSHEASADRRSLGGGGQVRLTPESLDESLDRLIGMQLVQRGERMAEVEYSFNHALTQEAIYDCIVPKARKELHLQVATAIEALFAERPDAAEFAGMLALHYLRGENLAKAEEYLVRAGAEAIRSAASNEAIYYFQEALEVYQRQAGPAADPDRRAELERNIGLAFYNKGHMVAAVEHFDRALKHYGAWQPRGRLATAAGLVVDFASILNRLYLRTGQPARTPSARDEAILDLLHKKGTAIVSVDTRRYFVESLGTVRRINRFDIRSVRNGPAIYAATSGLFSVPAISYTLSRRILDYVKPYIDESDPRTALYYRFSDLMLNLLTGRWSGPGCDAALVEANRRIGEEWFLSVYIVVHVAIAIEKGDFSTAERLLDSMREMGSASENDLILGRMHLLNTRFLLKTGRLDEARREAGVADPVLTRIGHHLLRIYLQGLLANVELHRGDRAAADATLDETRSLVARMGRIPPYYVSSYRVARLLADIQSLEEASRRDDRSAIAALRRQASDSAKRALRVGEKNATDRPEIFRLVGTLAWISGHETHARDSWDRSRREATQLGARPELERTDREIRDRTEQPRPK